MKNKFRILKILITVIIFGFLLSFSLKRFNTKPMENVTVNMTKTKSPVYFIDEKEVKDIVRKSNPTRKIGDINIPELEKKLNNLPAIDSANVYINLNGNLNLDIKQRVPAFRLVKGDKDFYVDEKGVEFPISPNYSFPCMLVTGNVTPEDYQQLAELVDKIDKDGFSKKYFIGISKEKGGYNLLTSQANYKVEIGELENIDLKVKGFKTFVEKHLVYQDPEKYSKVSVKYDNQIVTTLNPNYKENDSLITVGHKELTKLPAAAPRKTGTEAKLKETAVKKEVPKTAVKKTEKKATEKNPAPKPKVIEKPKAEKKEAPKPKNAASKTVTKPKAKVKIE